MAGGQGRTAESVIVDGFEHMAALFITVLAMAIVELVLTW